MLYRKQRVSLFFLLSLLYLISWIWQTHQLTQASRFPANLLLHPVTVQGTIESVTAVDTTATRFVLHLTAINKRIQLSWYYATKPIQPGQIWQFTVKLKPWHANRNPGLFDADHQAYVAGLAAHGYIYNSHTAVLIRDISHDPLTRLRNHLQQKIATNLAVNPNAVAIVSALVLGDKQAMTPALRQMVQATGTAHLLAISGLHIGMIAAFVYGLFLRIWRMSSQLSLWLPAKKASAIIAIITALGYTALTGFGLPAIRSFVMVSACSLAIILSKRVNGYQVYWFALFLGLIIQPYAIFNISFWLSYLAVFLILYAAACRYQQHKMRDYVRVQLSITIGLTPILFYYFQQTSFVGEVANFIAIPLVSFAILPLSFIACLLPITAVSHLLFKIDLQLVQLLVWYLDFLANLPFAVWFKGINNLLILFLAMLGVLLILLPGYLRLRYFGIFLLLPVFFYKPQHIKPNDFLVTVLDVGQGLSVLVQTAHHQLLYDLGPLYPGGASATQSVVVPYLHRQAINRIDNLIISHQDSDHKGNLPYFVQHYPISVLYTSATKALSGYKIIPCQQGQHWQWDGIQFAILSPTTIPMRGDNAQSCVLKIMNNQYSILLPGDIDQKTEKDLVRRYGSQLQATVLVLAHHGSNTASSEAFLRNTHPAYGVISAGFLNRYHFPSHAVLSRLHAQGIASVTTSDCGAVQLTFLHDAVFHLGCTRGNKT